MEYITVLNNLAFGEKASAEKPIQAREIFNGARRRIMEVEINENAVLTKHKAAEPITVLCLAGTGKFLAGPALEESVELTPGVFITLEADVLHEVAAEPYLRVLVTKYKPE